MSGKRCWHLLVLAALAALLVALSPIAALASDGEQTANLSYLPEVSTWGATDATGTARVNVDQGYVQFTIRGLPMLSGETYEAWLVTAGLAQWVSVGRFNPTAGPVEYLANIDEIPSLAYAYLVVTVEPSEGDTGEPSGRNVIGGLLVGEGAAAAPAQAGSVEATPSADPTVAAAATAIAEIVATTAPPPPTYLPVSGAAAAPFALAGIAGIVGIALVLVGGAVLTHRR